MKFFVAVSILIFSLVAITPASANTIGVQYVATQLSGSLWQYDYSVTGSFATNQGVAIYFPDPLYADPIADLTTGGADWTTFALDISSSLPAPGEFDIVANVNNPNLSDVFSMTFQWNGSGTPGTQAFDVFDFNSTPAILLASGSTVAAGSPTPTPEPSSLLLLGSGLAFLAHKRSRIMHAP